MVTDARINLLHFVAATDFVLARNRLVRLFAQLVDQVCTIVCQVGVRNEDI